MQEDFELTVFDRLEVIRKTIKEIGEGNCYISFSSGKDSTMLSYLVDEALPGNNIPRVYINTGSGRHWKPMDIRSKARNIHASSLIETPILLALSPTSRAVAKGRHTALAF